MKTLRNIIIAAAIALPSMVWAQDEHTVTYYDKNETVKKSEGDMLDGPENIHDNSFMFEPLIDLSVVHLKKLYTDVKRL